MEASTSVRFTEINNVSGITATSTVWRGKGSSFARIRELIPAFDVLAIEPFSFSHVSRYRDDYSDQPMGELLGQLVTDSSLAGNTSIPLPGKPTHLGLWIYDNTWQSPDQSSMAKPLDYLMIYAKLQTADNQVFAAKLTQTASSESAPEDKQWQYFEAVLPELSPTSYPISFHSFWFTMSRGDDLYLRTGYYRRVDLILDDFSITDVAGGESQIFDGFEEIVRIWQTNNQNNPVSYTKSLPNHSGQASLMFSLPYRINPLGYALIPVRTIKVNIIPALASKEFLTDTEASVGDTILLSINGLQMEVDIVGSVEYFPTMYDSPGDGFLIIPTDTLMYTLNRENRIPVNPNEIWIETENEEASSQIQLKFPYAVQTWDFGAERQYLRADALMLGIRSVTFLAYILTTILSLVGFATHFYMSARQREMQFGILRSLGLSPGQLYGWLLIEQIIIILAGLTLGTLLGILLNKLILPGLPISFGDRPAIPPFMPLENWAAVFKLYLTLLIAFMTSLGIATYILWRSNIHRALRIGQE
jgi:hypothetical protein